MEIHDTLTKRNLCPACIYVFKDFIYLFIFRERGREGGREGEKHQHARETSIRNINVWLPLTGSQLGTWPAPQACALTGTQTGDLSVCRPVLNPLSHTSQGYVLLLERKREDRELLPLAQNNPYAIFWSGIL